MTTNTEKKLVNPAFEGDDLSKTSAELAGSSEPGNIEFEPKEKKMPPNPDRNPTKQKGPVDEPEEKEPVTLDRVSGDSGSKKKAS